ncbi:MAG: lysylphosphatidylglycerol synthase transmembrane domain-containing protein [Gemmatimonadaceae bacterium]
MARKVIRPALVAVVVVALILFLGRIDWAQTWRAIRMASPAVLVLAAVVNMLSLALKAVRWWLFLRASGAPSLTLALRATFAGAALNNIVVANAGEAGRVMLVARSARVPSEHVLATLALERLFEFAGYVVMFVIAVSVMRLPPALDEMRPIAFVAAAALLAGLVYLARHPERVDAPPLAPAGLVRRAANYGRGFFRTLTGVSSARRFSDAMILSVVVWALQVATYQLTARAAHFDIPLSGTIACILAVNLGFAVRATPGNVGVFQAIYAMTAAAFGMDADVAVGVGLLIQAQQILPITLIGLVAAPQVTRLTAATPSAAGGA